MSTIICVCLSHDKYARGHVAAFWERALSWRLMMEVAETRWKRVVGLYRVRYRWCPFHYNYHRYRDFFQRQRQRQRKGHWELSSDLVI